MRFGSALVAPLALAATASARFVMYYDEWHPSRPDNAADRAGVDHLIMSFARSNDTVNYKPHVPIDTIKSEYPQAKIMIAIGGWNDTKGFSAAVASDEGITRYASDIKTMIDANGVDGVDIDWEYPGGNGADHKENSNESKSGEPAAFPKLLAAIRTAIGKDKILSVAVPGKPIDQIAFTPEFGPSIWESVDFVNVMSYDLMNRRDHVTAHHSSVKDSAAAIESYTAIGCPAEKLNLGFAYYAKWFTTVGDCSSQNLGCPIVKAENDDGTDAFTSGTFTYETANMALPNASIAVSAVPGSCGAKFGKCATGCCSQYNSCGVSAEHCNVACQFAYGEGCQGPNIAESWQAALAGGKTDEEAGGQYYFDAATKLFWTWDTPAIMERKYTEIVEKMGVGGIMAWSLGEDSYDWSHIKKMAQLAGGGGAGYAASPSGSKPAPSSSASKSATPTVSPGIFAPSATPSASSSKAVPVAPKSSYGADTPAVPAPSSSKATPAAPASSASPHSYNDGMYTPAPAVSPGVFAPSASAAAPSSTAWPAAPPASGSTTPDDDDQYETVCTRRLKKRSPAAEHVHMKRGHAGRAFLA